MGKADHSKSGVDPAQELRDARLMPEEVVTGSTLPHKVGVLVGERRAREVTALKGNVGTSLEEEDDVIALTEEDEVKDFDTDDLAFFAEGERKVPVPLQERRVQDMIRELGLPFAVAGTLTAAACATEGQPTEPVDSGAPVPANDSGRPAPVPPDAGFMEMKIDAGDRTDAGMVSPPDGGVREDARVADTGTGNPDAMTPPPMPDMPQVAQSLIEIGPSDRVFQAEIIVGQNTDTITLVGPDGFYQNVSVRSGSRVTVSVPETARPNPVQLEGNWRVHACNGGEGGQCTVSAAHFTVDRYQLPATPTVDHADVVMGPNMPEREIHITVADPPNTTEIRVEKDGVPMPAVPVMPGQTTYPFTIRMTDGAGMYEFRAACHGGRAVSANAARVRVMVDAHADTPTVPDFVPIAEGDLSFSFTATVAPDITRLDVNRVSDGHLMIQIPVQLGTTQVPVTVSVNPGEELSGEYSVVAVDRTGNVSAEGGVEAVLPPVISNFEIDTSQTPGEIVTGAPDPYPISFDARGAERFEVTLESLRNPPQLRMGTLNPSSGPVSADGHVTVYYDTTSANTSVGVNVKLTITVIRGTARNQLIHQFEIL